MRFPTLCVIPRQGYFWVCVSWKKVLNMEILLEQHLLSPTLLDVRTCGDCTACCTVLAVTELRKPMRWACQHVACGGCQVYDTRPPSCREFNCLWLRGAISGDGTHRPDKLGVLFDCFYSTAMGAERFVAFELWNGAFEERAGAAILAEMSADRELELSYRDGTWQTIGEKRAPIEQDNTAA